MAVTAWSVRGVDGGFGWSGAKMVVMVVESGGSVVWQLVWWPEIGRIRRGTCDTNEAWIFELKRELGRRDVKEKSLNRNLMNTSLGIGVSTELVNTINKDTLVGVAYAVNKGVTPSVVDMMVEMEKISSLEDTTVLGSFSPLSTTVTTMAGNALGKSLYAIVTGKPSGKKLNIRTLFTPGGNGIDGCFSGVYPSYNSMKGLDAMLENGPWFIQNHPLIMKKWHPDENLLKEDVSTIPDWVKLYGVPITSFSEDGLSTIATKLGVGDKKNLKKPSRTSRGVPVGPKIGFKPQK
uniref:Uncharacterized protein n=1 Tax=Tanacetum cinerariifolium TaxID=118510 RepID=A0A6L2LRX0_TANCI|nr:hypothetical protein [Tanacetum cinerariifolium]